jgi:NTE family protein
VAATLAAHGLALDHAVLDDPKRHLLAPRRPARSRSAHTLQRLDEVLDDLEGALQPR